MSDSYEADDPRSEAWREGYIEPPPGGGMPEKFRLMINRFKRGCEVCGVMDWKATASGEMGCRNCGNIFDKPIMDEPGAPSEASNG